MESRGSRFPKDHPIIDTLPNHPAAARVNIIVRDDVDLQSSNQIVWAPSTRLRPDKDVAFGDDGRIVFDTTRLAGKLEIPALPQNIIERISDRLRGDGR